MLTSKEKSEQNTILTAAHNDFEKSLNRHAFFKLNNHSVGEDLVQETFMKTWTYLVKGGKVHIMKAFLYHVLNNLIIDEYRKRKTFSLDSLLEKGFEAESPEPENTSHIVSEKNILLLVAKLPEKYRSIINMRYIQDLSLDEIHNLTGQPKKTISVQIFRGIEKLRIMYYDKEIK
jgi:RNA polymerase sigma factor (sigma-70 family)